MNRYYQDFTGKWVFRVGTDTVDNMWEPLESVEITDALACSRADVGPVFIAAHGGILPLFAVCKDNAISYLDDEDEAIRVPLVTCRIATPDELKAAGLWND